MPSAVVNLVSGTQPMIVYNVRRLLNEDKKKPGAVSRKINAPVSYQELLTIAQKGGQSGGKVDDITEIFGDPSNSAAAEGGSTQAKVSTIDRSKVPTPAAAAAISRKAAPKKRSTAESKLNSVALLILFLPPMLYYAVAR